MKFVVATTTREAFVLAHEYGHDSLPEAEIHLAEVQSPPTDPYYAAQYRVYKVDGEHVVAVTPSAKE